MTFASDGTPGVLVSAEGSSDIGIACSTNTTTSCDPGPMPVYDYKFIEFGENLYVEATSADGKDGVLVAAAGGGTGVGLYDYNYCEYEGNEEIGVGADCTTVQCIGLGWGLEIAKDGITKNQDGKITEVQISAPNWIYAEGNENADSTKDLANRLVIGKGLCVDKGDECERIVRANIGVKNSSKCLTKDFVGIDCESDIKEQPPEPGGGTTTPLPNGVVGIVAGAGISAKEETSSDPFIENNMWVHLQSDLKMTDCEDGTIANPLVEISLGCGLKGVGSAPCEDDSDNTKVTLELSPTSCKTSDIPVKVVCGISCSAEGIETIEKELLFSNCGLFLGTRNIDGKLNSMVDVGCQQAVTSSTEDTTPAGGTPY